MNPGSSNNALPLTLGEIPGPPSLSLGEMLVRGEFPEDLMVPTEVSSTEPSEQELGYGKDFLAAFNDGTDSGTLGESPGEHAARLGRVGLKRPREYGAYVRRLGRLGGFYAPTVGEIPDLRGRILVNIGNTMRPALLEELEVVSVAEISILDIALLSLASAHFYRILEARAPCGSKGDIQLIERLNALASRCSAEWMEALAFLRMLKGKPLQRPGASVQAVAVQVTTVVAGQNGGGHDFCI